MECFLSKADLHLDDRALIDYTRAWLTLIDKELVTCNFQRLTLLQIADYPAEEVGLQDLALD